MTDWALGHEDRFRMQSVMRPPPAHLCTIRSAEIFALVSDRVYDVFHAASPPKGTPRDRNAHVTASK